MSLETFVDALAEKHAAFFADNPRDSIAHCCLAITGDGRSVVVPLAWRNERQRVAMIRFLRRFMIAEEVTCYAVWAEVWTSVAPEPENYKHGDLAKDPARIEAVFTFAVDRDGGKAARMQKIIRDESGAVVRLELEARDLGDTIGGALATLLPEPERRVH